VTFHPPPAASLRRRLRTSRDTGRHLLIPVDERGDDDDDDKGSNEGATDHTDFASGAGNSNRSTNDSGSAADQTKKQELFADKLNNEQEKDIFERLETAEKILEPMRDLDKLAAGFTDLDHLSDFLERDTVSFASATKDAFTVGVPTFGSALQTTQGQVALGATLGLGAKVVGAYAANAMAGNMTLAEAVSGLAETASAVGTVGVALATAAQVTVLIGAEAEKTGDPGLAIYRGLVDYAVIKEREIRETVTSIYDKNVPNAY
jgi:hypothetical protein